MAQLRQENYSVDDSVVNIAFGTIAGGVFGAVGSAFRLQLLYQHL
jgi:hypothetical protein